MERRLKGLAAVTLAAGVTAALVAPSQAVADDTPAPDLATPEMLAAIERDLGLGADEALDRLASDLAAMDTRETLSENLGDSFAGAWIEDGELVVAVTDRDHVTEIRAEGARPEVVEHSSAQLAGIISSLDRTAPDASEVHGWYVDPTANEVVVEVAMGASSSAQQWLTDNGVDETAVRFELSRNAPETYYDIVGGYPYDVPGSGCSVGFAVQPRGFVTAGHCGTVGTPTTGHNGASQGTFQHSSFPGNDGAYVSANSSWTTHALVYRWDGNYLQVNGSSVAPIGAVTCRSGRTSGYRCGNIEAYNQTVNYGAGPVYGLTRTSACAAPGDSGGAFIAAGINAQGVTSGGSGFCGSGQPPQTYFQPVNELLNMWNLSLVTQ